ncbi:hypothetical protein HON03_03725 [archaeon]|nr:hypothetical protein [archaeon]MBT5288356.1 hypothetical protein [archaeon]
METKHYIALVLLVATVLFASQMNVEYTGFATLEENSTEETIDETSEEETTTEEETTEETVEEELVEEEEEEEVETITYTIPAANLELDLDANKYATNTAIEGTISLTLNENFSPEEELTVTIDDTVYTYNILDLLNSQNYSLIYDDLGYEATNSEATKTIEFTEAGTKIIGLQIPRYAEIETASFSLTGTDLSSSYLTNLSMDVGGEGNADWLYIGSFTGYSEDLLKSIDLDENTESTGYIQDNETYYCELLELPASKNFQITAEYEKVGTYGDIQATILSVPTGKPNYGWSGGADSCDLPETQGSCEIDLSYSIDGIYMLCIYSEGEFNEEEYIYNLPLDTSASTTTSFTCPTVEDSLCEETGFSNFLIYAQAAEYDSQLTGTANLEDWETFTDAVITGVKYYVGSEPYSGICKTDICSVPIEISSATAGSLTISNLSLTYEYNGVTQSSSVFYDLISPTANITYIEAQDLSLGAYVDIPLSALELAFTDYSEYTIDLSFLDLSTSGNFEIVSSDDIYSAESLITTILERYDSYTDSTTDEYQVLLMLDELNNVNNNIETLESYQDQLTFTDEDTLLTSVETLLSDEIWIIAFSESFSDSLIVEPSDIPSSLGDESDIYFMQEAVDLEGRKKTINIHTYGGETTTYTFIHKEIDSNEDVDGYLYEIIPTSDVSYSVTPDSSSSSMITYTYSVSSNTNSNYYYLAPEGYSLDDFITLIVFEEEEEEEPSYICGDGVCSTLGEDEDSCPEDCATMNIFLYVIIILILAVGLLVLINFKDKIFKKKDLGKTETKPKSSMDSFIEKAREKKISDETIAKTLKKKGWTDDKIKAALK